jgi:TPR repeat protein
MNLLASCYVEGRGVAPNTVAAAAWYRKSAEAGNHHGMLGIGEAYMLGKGVPQNTPRACQWLLDAIRHGVPDPDGVLARILPLDDAWRFDRNHERYCWAAALSALGNEVGTKLRAALEPTIPEHQWEELMSRSEQFLALLRPNDYPGPDNIRSKKP